MKETIADEVLALVEKAGKEANMDTPVVKPGWKTSEFWMSLFTTVGSVLGQVGGLIPPPWGIVVGAVCTMGYTISRAFIKTNPPQ